MLGTSLWTTSAEPGTTGRPAVDFSRLTPRWIALGMYATGAVYLVGSFAAVFAPDLLAVIDPFYGIALVVEFGFAICLLRGLRPRTVASGRPE